MISDAITIGKDGSLTSPEKGILSVVFGDEVYSGDRHYREQIKDVVESSVPIVLGIPKDCCRGQHLLRNMIGDTPQDGRSRMYLVNRCGGSSIYGSRENLFCPDFRTSVNYTERESGQPVENSLRISQKLLAGCIQRWAPESFYNYIRGYIAKEDLAKYDELFQLALKGERK
jgi:hypothetical protein